jgi:S1-C subfamily serine protease
MRLRPSKSVSPSQVTLLGIGKRHKTAPIHPRIARYLGLKQSQGLLVLHVDPDSPAAKAGLAEGDVVIGFKNNRINGIDELQRMLVASEIGLKSPLTIVRHNFQANVEITPQEAPQLS